MKTVGKPTPAQVCTYRTVMNRIAKAKTLIQKRRPYPQIQGADKLVYDLLEETQDKIRNIIIANENISAPRESRIAKRGSEHLAL